MQKTYLKVTGWYKDLNIQQKLGFKLMIFGALLAVYAILGMMGYVPNPLPNA